MKGLIIKFGTESLLGKNENLSQDVFNDVARQIAELKRLNFSITLVSSGAIKAGREIASQKRLPVRNLHKKDLAGLGSNRLMSMWDKAFDQHSIAVAQVWVTHANLSDESERKSVSSSLENFHHAGVVPIVNENDVVSAREIILMEQRISENDQLTRLITDIEKPSVVIFVTSVGGVYENNPKTNSDSRKFCELDANALPECVLLESKKSKTGRGGMGKKVIEAAKCYDGKRKVVITNTTNDGIVRAVLTNQVGTLIGERTRLY